MGKSSKMLCFTRFFAVFRLLEVPLQQALQSLAVSCFGTKLLRATRVFRYLIEKIPLEFPPFL